MTVIALGLRQNLAQSLLMVCPTLLAAIAASTAASGIAVAVRMRRADHRRY